MMDTLSGITRLLNSFPCGNSPMENMNSRLMNDSPNLNRPSLNHLRNLFQKRKSRKRNPRKLNQKQNQRKRSSGKMSQPNIQMKLRGSSKRRGNEEHRPHQEGTGAHL